MILAAGTLGSTEILLRCRENGLPLSDHVGEHFSTNGDTLGFAYNTDHVVNGIGLGARQPDPRSPIGPTATEMVDFRDDSAVGGKMLLEEAAVPGALADFLAPMLAAEARLLGTRAHHNLPDAVRKEYREIESKVLGPYTGATRNTSTLILLASDDSAGRMCLSDDRLRIEWPGLGDQPQWRQASQLLQRVASALGGDYIPNPIWKELTHYTLATAHPLGGCVMADGPDRRRGQSQGPGLHGRCRRRRPRWPVRHGRVRGADGVGRKPTADDIGTGGTELLPAGAGLRLDYRLWRDILNTTGSVEMTGGLSNGRFSSNQRAPTSGVRPCG